MEQQPNKIIYDLHETLVKRDGNILWHYKMNLPTNFETLIDYVENKKSKFLMILDDKTIAIKIDKRKSILLHKTLLESVVDISYINGSYRFANYMTLTIDIAYRIICQYN